MILDMTRPITSSRVVVIEDRRGANLAPGSVLRLRRYRIARLRAGVQGHAEQGRLEYLKRIPD